MPPTPKTIQIFLPGGDPRGIRIAEITTRIVQAIEVPRKLLPEFLAMDESTQVALYFLFGESDDDGDNEVYIGQTSDLRARLPDHNKKKDFWQRAVVVISRTQNLTQTHALFLEWQSIQQCRAAERYAGQNGNAGSRPFTPAPLEADCVEIFETTQTLLATLGYPVFDKLTSGSSTAVDEYFYCTASSCQGKGQYTEEGFVVLKDSVGRLENVVSIQGTPVEAMRVRLLESGVMEADGDRVVFLKDHLFNSPSQAAAAVLGRSSNGWVDWKDERGRTLDELKRQTPGESD